MTRVNKTIKNLQLVWQQLDDACGSLDNAKFNIASMTDMPYDVRNDADQIDISQIVVLKNQIEELIEEKRKNMITIE